MCACAHACVCVCVLVHPCIKGGIGGRKSQKCQLFTVVNVGGLAGGCGGVPEVRAGPVALATLRKIASSALLVTLGFFFFSFSLSLRSFLSLSGARHSTSGTSETESHHKTKQRAVSSLLCPLFNTNFPSLFFSYLLYLSSRFALIHHGAEASAVETRGSGGTEEEGRWQQLTGGQKFQLTCLADGLEGSDSSFSPAGSMIQPLYGQNLNKHDHFYDVANISRLKQVSHQDIIST